MEYITWQNLFGAIGILGTVFTIYRNFIAAPSEKATSDNVLQNFQIGELNKSITKIMTNDLPHMDDKIATIHGSVDNLRLEVAKLGTIIDERIPKKS